jgi:hypothetical protein
MSIPEGLEAALGFGFMDAIFTPDVYDKPLGA